MKTPRGPSLAPLLLILFVSGIAAVSVEVVWARMLSRILGSTALAVAAVVGGFLGGLGLGSFAAERALPRPSSPLKAYAAAELAALATTVGVSGLLERLAFLLEIPAGEVLVVLFAAVAAAPWGAAFPFVAMAIAARPDVRAALSRVYGMNALGSAAGGLAAGLAGIPLLGEWGTLGAAAACEVLAAAGALALAQREKGPEQALERGEERGSAAALALASPAPSPSSDPALALGSPGVSGSPGALAGSFLFLSGLVAIYWEVLWTRILVLVVGATVYSFCVISASVILGIALGSLGSSIRWPARRDTRRPDTRGPDSSAALLPARLQTRRTARRMGWALPAAAAALLAAGYLVVPFLPDAYLAGVRGLGLSPLVAGVLGAGALVFLPNFLLGSLFPWAIAPRIQAAGAGYAVNCAGSVAGALLGGPVAAALLGLEDAYRSGVAGLAAVAALGWLLGRADGRHGRDAGGAAPMLAAMAIAGAAAAAVLLLTIHVPPLGRSWDPERLLSGVYQWSREDLESLPIEKSFAAREILALEAGKEVIVTVELDREANTVYVRGNGKVEGSVPADPSRSSLADLPTQITLGALPGWILAGRPSRSVLLVGLGSGVTLGAILRSEGPKAEGSGAETTGDAIDVIEIEEAFLRALGSQAARPYIDPYLPAELSSRARFHFGDARRLLRSGLRGRSWDAIVSQPSEPWIPGAAPLFTEEFFKVAAGRLRPGGVFIQWLQLYKLEVESVRLLLRTFRRVFPEVFVFRPPGTGELVLLGSAERVDLAPCLRLPVEPQPEAAPARVAAGLEVPADRLAMILLGPRGVDAWVGLAPDLPVNTDSRSDLAYLAARSLYGGRELARANLEALRVLGGADPATAYLGAGWRNGGWRDEAAFRRHLAARNVRVGDLQEALAILGDDSSEEARALREEISRREKRP